MKKNTIDEELEMEDDPIKLLSKLCGSLDIGLENVLAKPVTQKKRNRIKNQSTQVDMINDNIPEECVSRWLFTTSPSIKPEKPSLKQSETSSLNYPKNDTVEIDDGSYPNDPILKILRERLRKCV